MRYVVKKILLCAVLLLLVSGVEAQNACRYVDPFIGTGATGHTFPGATRPFGLVQASPVTGSVGWQYCAEYVNTDTLVYGFSQTHLSGTGCMDLGDILLMPIGANNATAPFASRLDKRSEQASPGYYACTLLDAAVRAEVAATPHAALYRFAPTQREASAPTGVQMLVDLQHGPAWSEAQQQRHVRKCEWRKVDDYTLEGHTLTAVWTLQDVYFTMKFSQPIARLDTLQPRAATERAPRLVVSFRGNEADLYVKIALSANSLEGARKNLQVELPAAKNAFCNFRATRRAAAEAWENILSRMAAKGTADELKNFYTALYHLCIQPNNLADAGAPPYFSTFSCWDTYRAAHPLYTLLVPELVPHFVRSLVLQAERLGHLPVWGLWGNDTDCMPGNHAVAIIAEAYVKGLAGDMPAERAFAAVRRTLTTDHGSRSRFGLLNAYGYLPADSMLTESVSQTLEGAYDDYAAACLARIAKRSADAAFFEKRAAAWRQLWDAPTGFFRPRLANGAFEPDFSPTRLSHAESRGGAYTEGNAWQYLWHVQQAPLELARLMGGRQAMVARLDTFFTLPLLDRQADVTGLIGQYAHGNEPSHHVPFLYFLLGAEAKGNAIVSRIFKEMYRPTPDGLCGNDDCGQMSAWYVFAAMGMYPVDPVSGTYVKFKPQMKVRLRK